MVKEVLVLMEDLTKLRFVLLFVSLEGGRGSWFLICIGMYSVMDEFDGRSSFMLELFFELLMFCGLASSSFLSFAELGGLKKW